jgi:hypothetical protein
MTRNAARLGRDVSGPRARVFLNYANTEDRTNENYLEATQRFSARTGAPPRGPTPRSTPKRPRRDRPGLTRVSTSKARQPKLTAGTSRASASFCHARDSRHRESLPGSECS